MNLFPNLYRKSLKTAGLFLAFMLFHSLAALSYTEENIKFVHQGKQLDAVLCLPDGDGPFPVIILHPGSGAMDKDGTVSLVGGQAACLYPGLNGKVLKPYLHLRRGLAEAGFAVVTYDKMEYAYAAAPPVDFEALFLPSASLLPVMAQHPKVDPNQIILMGHSEGSSLIPYIHRQNPLYSIRAMVSLAGPRRPLDTVLADQLYRFALKCQQDTAMARVQGNQILDYGGLIRSGSWDSSTPPLFGLPAASWSRYFQVVDSVAYYYQNAQIPVLFVGLEEDLNVPVDVEWARFKQEVPNADFYRLPSIHHLLSTATDPIVSSLLIDSLVYWLKKQNLSVKDQAYYNASHFDLDFNGQEARIEAREGYITQVCLIDARGAQIFQASVYEKSLNYNLSELPAGTYVFLISGQHHQQSFRFSILR